MLRRVRNALHASLALAAGVVAACSSFGSSGEPAVATPEAGVDGALMEAGAPDASAACIADLTTDAKNCGKCGHDCQGGACSASRCQPFKLADFTDEPVANVVLSATNVFWNTMEGLSGGPGNVYTCPKAGCGGAPTMLPAAGNVVRGLGSDGAQKTFAGAFYANGGLFELGPSTMTPVLTVMQGGFPFQMSVRPDAIFYVSFYDADKDRTVRRWDYVNAPTNVCTFATGETTTAAAFTAMRVYLSSNSTGKLYSCPLSGTNGAFVVYLDNLFLGSLAATADRIFWALDGSVTSSADGPTSPSLHAELGPLDVGSSDVTTITISGGDLFAATAAGELWSCAPSDCKSSLRRVAKESLLETSHAFISHTVAADADAIYYVAVDSTTEGGTQRSSRLMKVIR